MNTEQSNIAPTVIHTLRNRVITNMDKYMQEAEKAQEAEDNYFDAVTHSTNTSPMPETVETQSTVSDEKQKEVAKKLQTEGQSKRDILESLSEDTGKTIEETNPSDNIENTDPNQQDELSPIEEEESYIQDTEATETAVGS